MTKQLYRAIVESGVEVYVVARNIAEATQAINSQMFEWGLCTDVCSLSIVAKMEASPRGAARLIVAGEE